MKLENLVKAESAIAKLINYGYLPARQIFFMSTAHSKIQDAFDAYHCARNLALSKHGESEDGINYVVPAGEKAEAYGVEIQELLEQEIDIEFPPERITLCPESIDKTEIGLDPEERLGFNAKDWLVIQEVVKVVETEE